MKWVNSASRKSTSSLPLPALWDMISFLRRGKPNISPSGSWASTNPITVEEEVVSHRENELFLLVRHARHQAERHAPRHELLCITIPLQIGGSWPALA